MGNGRGGVAQDTARRFWQWETVSEVSDDVAQYTEEWVRVKELGYNTEEDSYGDPVYEFDIPKLEPEFKAEWIKALRSGKYKQARSHLVVYEAIHNYDEGPSVVEDIRYCCLGVACDIIKHDGWDDITKEDIDNVIWTYGKNEVHNNSTDLPFVEEKLAETLAAKNDHGATFNEIADWIEENL